MIRSYEQGQGAAAPLEPASTAVAGAAIGEDAAHEPQASLDSITASGERVIFHWGLGVCPEWLVPDGVDPAGGGARVYPDNETPRVLARGEQLLMTAGCVLGLRVVAVPSGPTQTSDGFAGFESGGGAGRVELAVTYSNSDGDTVTVLAAVEIQASDEVYSAEPEALHEALQLEQAAAVPVAEQDAALQALYARGLDVLSTWEMRVTGSPRLVDAAVVELTRQVLVEQDSSNYPSAMYTEAGQTYEQLPSDYPIERLSLADQGGGTLAIRAALLEHGRALGPAIATWSSGDECSAPLSEWIDYDAGTGDGDPPPYATFGLTRVQVPYGSPAEARFPAMQTGSYARGVPQGDDWSEATGVIPVITVWRVRGTNAVFELCGGDPTSEVWACLDLSVSTDDVWVTRVVPGWLEVGEAPDRAPPLRIFARQSAIPAIGLPDFGAQVRYVGVYFRRR